MFLAVCDPLVGTVPVKAPDAVQVSAFVEDQVSVELPPETTLLGFALKDTVGGVTLTDTVAELLAEPPLPVQARTNFVVALNATVVWVPLVGSAPVQPFDAVHELVFVEVQVNTEVLPLLTVVGFAVIVTTGAGAVTVMVAEFEALPPAPVQESVKLVVAVRAPVAALPLMGCAPDQPPDAVHEVAFVAAQVRVAVPPFAIVLGFAVIFTVGAGVLTDTVADCDALPPEPAQVKV